MARATTRPTGGYPPAPEDDEVLADWLVEGAGRLVEVLRDARYDEEVWTISRTWREVGFWRRRMVLETALHRWDAEDATGEVADVEEAVALAGLEEALDVYLAQRLGGAEVGGDGQRVAFVPGTAGEAWTLTLLADGVELTEGAEDADAVVAGSALDLWLLVTCRRGLEGLSVEGDGAAAALAVQAARLSPGPAG